MKQTSGPRSLHDPLERSAFPGESSRRILHSGSAANHDREYPPAHDDRLIEELHRAAHFLHAHGCPDGAVAVDESVRRLGLEVER
jgi:hypothetical protein